MRSPGTVSRIMTVIGLALTLCLTGCGGATGSASPSAQNSTTALPGFPLGLFAIGHSGLTGESSDLSRPGLDAPRTPGRLELTLRSTAST
jgi:hypothetical protein